MLKRSHVFVPQCVKGFCPRGFIIYKTRFSQNRSDRMWDPPILLFDGYREFRGGKLAGA